MDLATILAKLTSTESALAAMTSERDAALAISGLQTKRADTAEASLATANGTITALTAERDALKAKVTDLEARDADVNKRAAKLMADAGFKTQPVAATGDPAPKKLTLTEQCAKAMGVTLTPETKFKL